ncbi:glucanotransferase domain of glycogen debranching enzyme-domain-containing protein [Chytriomyces cf. hyalinus JEL632]|nr:glucanotransferase domain of glycogen debranching enzyme-domain-containing protein [Chytriomyces cf. hyalinus JEL632]
MNRLVEDSLSPQVEKVSKSETLLPLDAICVLTVIPKWMPTLDKWPPFFKSFADAGYNMIHFAPLNTRGASNSPYSIYDQLSFSHDLFDSAYDEPVKESLLKSMLLRARNEFGILSCTDVVWNHTAHNSQWLEEHPEAGYNLQTAPHLRAAFELDEAICNMHADLESAGVSASLKTEDHLTQIMNVFKDTVLPRLKLWEFYVIDVTASVASFKHEFVAGEEGSYDHGFVSSGLRVWADTLKNAAVSSSNVGTRFNKTVTVSAAIPIVQRLTQKSDSMETVLRVYTNILNEINAPFYAEADEDVSYIIKNVWSRARYMRVDPHGPQLGLISNRDPLVDTYFTRLPLNTVTSKYHDDTMCLANNGWIWNGDPLQNFAGPDSKAYLRREVIAWGDCVKLRYGTGPSDNPWLWAHQKAYTEKMARLFHGFRIDNCHSTPIHVAAYLLDAARKINPDLYVFAELFTGSEETDTKFVSKLGINSLIREAMSAWDPKEMSRLVHRYGGTPIGSLTSKEEYFPLDMMGHPLDSKFFQTVEDSEEIVVDVKGSAPHALFMDCTHDNETPHQKRTAEDTLPTAALVAMTACAVGSVKGFDEVVPELLNVVTETRKYRLAEEYEGIIPAKSILLDLHAKMAREGYTEIHVNQENDFISVHRIHPITHDGYLLVARCAFSMNHGDSVHSPIVLRNQSVHVVESAGLRRARLRGRKTIGAIAGLPCFLDFSAVLTTLIKTQETSFDDGNMETQLTINGGAFLPGSIVLFRTWMNGNSLDAGKLWLTNDQGKWPPGLWEAVDCLTDADINIVLYRCGNEEADSIGDGAYNIPGHGELPYCGLEGFMSVIETVARENDLGHAICANLRAGPWMMEYVVSRLKKYSSQSPNVAMLAKWFEERFEIIKSFSPSYIPKYFLQVIFLASNAVRYKAVSAIIGKRSKFICPDLAKASNASSLQVLSQSLLLTTYQLYGRIPTTGLFPPGRYPDAPYNSPSGAPSLAAGLPHFASRHMRCWGRDIFIALRGLFLIPGHYDAAKSHLISFGSTLRHGLIPNLLDQGNYPRYNARDASWWWLWGVQQYCKHAPEGLQFLKVVVRRRFPPVRRYRAGTADYLVVEESEDVSGDEGDVFVDTNDERMYKYSSTIGQLCHEILERHARGIDFREWNAGPQLDHAMQDDGFRVSCHARFDDQSGIVFGGNRFNCGTWMDKMGDSEKAGTKGLPATPRDGGSVEIVGLLKASLRWISEDVLVSKDWEDFFPANGVVLKDKKKILYSDWNLMLKDSFEKWYFIPEATDDQYELSSVSAFISKRGIYKDTLESSQPYTDVQFRPNFCVALAVAPELFNPDHARIALEQMKKDMLGPLGMKTLHPSDWAYRGNYDNANDSTDGTVAHGFNYHNGPEWGWLVGFFLTAYLQFNAHSSGCEKKLQDKLIHWVQGRMLNQKQHIRNLVANPFAGLPELTNANGEYCHHSCPTQAWSSATLLEAVSDVCDLTGN